MNRQEFILELRSKLGYGVDSFYQEAITKKGKLWNGIDVWDKNYPLRLSFARTFSLAWMIYRETGLIPTRGNTSALHYLKIKDFDKLEKYFLDLYYTEHRIIKINLTKKGNVSLYLNSLSFRERK